MKMITPGVKVLVETDDCPAFEGELVFAAEWENPFSVTRKKGIEYHVKADDDGHTYKTDERYVTKIKK